MIYRRIVQSEHKIPLQHTYLYLRVNKFLIVKLDQILITKLEQVINKGY